jgi:hypothetical protein
MTPVGLSEILDAFEANLELERELGTRSFEIDRAVLASFLEQSPARKKMTTQPRKEFSPASSARVITEQAQVEKTTLQAAASVQTSSCHALKPPSAGMFKIAFVHDRKLSPGALEIIKKALAALKLTESDAVVVEDRNFPNAGIYVFLGVPAARNFMPAADFSTGVILQSGGGRKFIVTHSPEQIVRFASIPDAVKKFKVDLWMHMNMAVKAVQQF